MSRSLNFWILPLGVRGASCANAAVEIIAAASEIRPEAANIFFILVFIYYPLMLLLIFLRAKIDYAPSFI